MGNGENAQKLKSCKSVRHLAAIDSSNFKSLKSLSVKSKQLERVRVNDGKCIGTAVQKSDSSSVFAMLVYRYSMV